MTHRLRSHKTETFFLSWNVAGFVLGSISAGSRGKDDVPIVLKLTSGDYRSHSNGNREEIAEVEPAGGSRACPTVRIIWNRNQRFVSRSVRCTENLFIQNIHHRIFLFSRPRQLCHTQRSNGVFNAFDPSLSLLSFERSNFDCVNMKLSLPVTGRTVGTWLIVRGKWNESECFRQARSNGGAKMVENIDRGFLDWRCHWLPGCQKGSGLNVNRSITVGFWRTSRHWRW